MIPIQHINLCDLPLETWDVRGGQRGSAIDFTAVRRISIGSYFCEMQFFAWSQERLARLAAWTEQRSTAISLVIPCPRESLYESVCKKAEELLGLLPACDEVVLNDEAMAGLAMFSGKKLVAGRTLCKYEHDFRLDDSAERMKAMRRAADMLMEGPWSIVEADSFDVPLLGAEMSDEVLSRLRFHAPAVMLSSTRHCQFAVRDLGVRDLLTPYIGCQRQCGGTWVAYRNRLLKFGRGIYRLLPADYDYPRNAAWIYWPVIEAMEAMK